MTEAVLPLWLEIIVAVLVLSGAALALLGSTGLLRLPTFFERVHAPAIIATLGCWLIMHGTVKTLGILSATRISTDDQYSCAHKNRTVTKPTN